MRNFRDMRDLGEKFQFQLRDESDVPYRLLFEGGVATPKLDAFIAQGDPKLGTPFKESDLVPARVGLQSHEGSLLHCVPITWAQHVWCNADRARLQLPLRERLFALSVAVLVESSDGFFPLALRSQKVTLYKGCRHVGAAGYVDLKKAQASQSLLPSVFAEVYEELNLPPADVEEVRQLGLIKHTTPDVAVFEACFYAKATLTGEALMERAQSARDKYEHKYTLYDRDGLGGFLKTGPLMPPAAASIALVLGY